MHLQEVGRDKEHSRMEKESDKVERVLFASREKRRGRRCREGGGELNLLEGI